jgi:hypothetical protein
MVDPVIVQVPDASPRLVEQLGTYRPNMQCKDAARFLQFEQFSGGLYSLGRAIVSSVKG